MSFLNLAALGLLGLLPVIVILYLLKLKRKPLVISSHLLWKKAIEDYTANTPFQKLRKNLLLLIQLILLTLLILGLARPMIKTAEGENKSRVIIIDASASMNANDTGVSRFESAKKKAEELIRDMGSGDKSMLIVSAAQTTVRQGFTDSKSELLRALEKIKSTDTSGDLREALTLAVSLFDENDDGEIVIISDGGGGDISDFADVNYPLHYIPVGVNSDNVGITGIDIRSSFQNPDARQIFISIENFSEREEEITLEMKLNNRLIDARLLKFAPGQRISEIFEYSGNEEGIIKVSLDHYDSLEQDNTVYSYMTPRNDINILLVSTGNYFLERCLMLDPRVRVSKISPAEYTARGDYDIVVFDGFTPDFPVGQTPAVFINCLPQEVTDESRSVLEYPTILDWDRSHPIMRFIDMSDVMVAEAKNVSLPPVWTPIVNSVKAPLVAVMDGLEHRWAYIGFELYNSNWTLRVSFPIFIANAIKWLTEPQSKAEYTQIITGTPIPIYFDDETEKYTVIDPHLNRHEVLFQGNPTFFTKTDFVGSYKIEGGDATRTIAANLTSERESNIDPKPEVKIGAASISGDTDKIKRIKEIWPWLAWAALALLVFEWYVYHRRRFL